MQMELCVILVTEIVYHQELLGELVELEGALSWSLNGCLFVSVIQAPLVSTPSEKN